MVVESFQIYAVNKIRVNECFWIVSSEESLEVGFGELFLNNFIDSIFVLLKVFVRNKSIAVSSLTLMDPELNDFFWLLIFVWVTQQKTLENVSYMS